MDETNETNRDGLETEAVRSEQKKATGAERVCSHAPAWRALTPTSARSVISNHVRGKPVSIGQRRRQ